MKKKVLIVDDDAFNLLLEKDLLTVAGMEVFQAENAADGIAIAKKEKPDIIIMDLRLPDMHGTMAAKILSLDKDVRDIPIVFVTASVLESVLDEISGLKKSGFIGKPIDTRTFAKEVMKYIK